MTISLSPPESTAPSSLDVARSARRRSGRRWVALGIASVALLFGVGYLPRQARRSALAAQAAQIAREPAQVSVVSPVLAQTKRPLLLPGSVVPLEQAKVYSRANGYVKAWHADMGDHVEAGTLLAELDTPELDREIEQARASLAQADVSILQARATLAYSISTRERYVSLTQLGLSSQQELEERKAQAHVDATKVRVAETERSARAAQLSRLQQLGSFARVLAPFAGTVAARNIERGTLISAAAGTPLFEIVAASSVRVFLQVPQSLVQGVHSGLGVRVEVNEYPGQSFAGNLTRSSGALDPESRTMRAEVQVPNPEGKLLPGMYASVRLELESARRAYVLPATAIIQRKTGPVVATVDGEARVRVLPVEIERDSGAEIEIRSGLTGNERVIRAPAPDLVDGAAVTVAS
jgi:RND family efflux transporter MFP subunit